ncbi:MAG: SufE family protein [Hyphomicrobium sp.]|uniref:SufE family protein n=1 Tax=Hyphomicrobium sp. TaxID=82 RepID=UPI00132B95E4|nr:SufE family protein [Hyphomicrobium sp.]KAB2940558.1 MAG: SufE family protein [Hyphomicrobium sp.]MBZ0210342.1 SufE family protein [Hyphomicrobium sp.]MCZ7595239.1 SufE family protein [Hyphomicrobium sp.]
MPTLSEITSDFAVLDDWEDRYRYLIELGRGLPPLPEALRTDANKVRGCASQVWLATSTRHADGRREFSFLADSDAHIVRGLIAILAAIYNGRSVDEVLALDPDPIFGKLGLKEHLTPQRSNGLASMVARVRADAAASAQGAPAT